MVAVTISQTRETIGGVTDHTSYISLPVKKGTVFMFVPWHTERIATNAKIKEALKNDGVGADPYKMLYMPAYIPYSDGPTAYVNNIEKDSSHTSTVRIHGVDYEYNSYPVWTSDPDQRKKLVGTGDGKFEYLFGNDKNHGDYGQGTIATVTELP